VTNLFLLHHNLNHTATPNMSRTYACAYCDFSLVVCQAALHTDDIFCFKQGIGESE
jgi:hypothetical protein